MTQHPGKTNERTGEDLPEGTLYVVATPIGNQEDITLRALRILAAVDLVASEDTRHTRKLLAYHGIRARLVSFHEHNEAERTGELVERLKAGSRVALVSDAGTPLVSDPGYRLVCAAAAEGIPVVPIPGPSSLTAALCISGLPTDAFVFTGFLPRKKEKRSRQLLCLKDEDRTLVFFESPRRIGALLAEVYRVMGDRQAVLCREMTKRHEECLRGRLSELIGILSDRAQIKGECTLLIAGRGPAEDFPPERIEADIRRRMASGETRLSAMAREIAQELGVSKSSVYEKALEIKRDKMR
jgi:16S rRNA (cytidine1402-2'-O)-methyltransferase